MKNFSLSVECDEKERENGVQEESRVAFKEEACEKEVDDGTKKNTDTFRSHEEHMKHLAGTENTFVWFHNSTTLTDTS